MSTKAREQLASQTNAEHPNNLPSKPLFEQNEIENTPFTVISDLDNNKHYVVWGRFRLSKEYDSMKKAYEAAERKDWEIIFNVIAIIAKEYDKPTSIHDEQDS